MASTTEPEPPIRPTDFCNSFWGLGDTGVNVLVERMQNATKTTEELRDYWDQRAMIEAEYSARLGKLAHRTLGTHEIGELQTALHTLNITTTSMSKAHAALAQHIRNMLYEPTCALLAKQKEHRETYEADILQRLKVKKKTEAYVSKAREKYEGDWVRINSYTAQLAHSPSVSTISSASSGSSAPSANIQRLRTKLARARETVAANEQDYQTFLHDLEDMIPRWETDWKGFCDECQDLEEERGDSFREWMWGYANAVSTGCVSDDQSCETLRLALDILEPEKEVDNFAREFGTGGMMEVPPAFAPPEEADGGVVRPSPPLRPTMKEAQFVRLSTRVKDGESRPVYREDDAESPGVVSPPGDAITPLLKSLQDQAASSASTNSKTASEHSTKPAHTSPPQPMATPAPTNKIDTRTSPPPPFDLGPAPTGHNPVNHHHPYAPPPPPQEYPQYSGPARAPSRSGRSLPQHSSRGEPAPPSSSITDNGFTAQQQPGGDNGTGEEDSEGRKFLFYVKAIYDYTATTAEEFDFQAGDVIAVIATPDDGWWTGELLDEQRRVQGQNIFPSNFVELF